MNTKHPGPWKFGVREWLDDDRGVAEKPFNYVGPGYYENPSIFDANGDEVVGCDEYYVFDGPESVRLIAAAPELLEALQAMTKLYCDLAESCDGGFWDAEEEHEVKAARAAIAKATGHAS